MLGWSRVTGWPDYTVKVGSIKGPTQKRTALPPRSFSTFFGTPENSSRGTGLGRKKNRSPLKAQAPRGLFFFRARAFFLSSFSSPSSSLSSPPLLLFPLFFPPPLFFFFFFFPFLLLSPPFPPLSTRVKYLISDFFLLLYYYLLLCWFTSLAHL